MPKIHNLVVTYSASLLLLACSITARHNHKLSWGVQQRGWGLKNHAKISQSSQRQSLDSYLLQVRGGSDYPGSGDYRGDDYRYRDDYTENRRQRDIYDEYDDRGVPTSRPKEAMKNPLSTLQSKIKNGDRTIGGALVGLGVVFTLMGFSLFFNKSLMRLGNLMFIAGVPTLIGPSRTVVYFFKPEKTRATACLFIGIFFVFVGWPMFGIALEIFGLLNLFGNMFPLFWAIFKNTPGVSSLLKSGGSGSNRRQSSSYRDYDYERDPYVDDDRRGYGSSSYDRDPYYDDRKGYGDYKDDGAEPFY